jgi:shikimate 5-dehydrogenase
VIDLIKELKRVYFGIDFRFVSQGQLVLLPGSNSVVVNSTPYTATNEIVKELACFNFLKAPGMIWELSLGPIETELVVESRQIGATAIRGHEIAMYTDKKWTEWVAPDKAAAVDFQRYADLLYEKYAGPSTQQAAKAGEDSTDQA